MAKARKAKEEAETNESVETILGKIKNIVSGKQKVVIEEDDNSAAIELEEDEPFELTEVVEGTENNSSLNNLSENPNDGGEEKFVDLLEEIDSALEKEFLAQQAVPEEPLIELTEPIEEIKQPDALVTPQPEIQTIAEVVPEIKKELPENISANIINEQQNIQKTNEPTGNNMTDKKENILSDDLANRSSKAIQNLLNNIPRPHIDSPVFRSAVTIEDIVMETMRPLLKEWLDQNLEIIVRDIVQKEIKKIIPRD